MDPFEKLSFILLLLFTFTGCNSKTGNHLLSGRLVMPDLVEARKYDGEKVNISWFKMGSYTPFYIGPYKKAVTVDPQNLYPLENDMAYDKYWDYPEGDTLDIKLWVDTTKIVSHPYVAWFGQLEDYFEQDVVAYPVILQNNSRDTSTIGYEYFCH